MYNYMVAGLHYESFLFFSDGDFHVFVVLSFGIFSLVLLLGA